MPAKRPKRKIADRFQIAAAHLSFERGRGWFYRGRFLHTSYYELQHTPAWANRRIADLWVADRHRGEVHVRMSSEPFGNDDYYYPDVTEALEAIRRLCYSAAHQNDGVERIIGIVINGEEDADEDTE